MQQQTSRIERIRDVGQGRQGSLLLTLRLALTLGALGSPAAASAAADAAYPVRPIRLIVPYAPGGAVDAVGRIFAQDLTTRLSQQVVVDNRAGGGGLVGFEIAARAVPDGYTLLIGSVGLASMPGLYRKLPFDPLRDFTPVSISLTGTYLLGVNPGIAASSVKELITLAKQNPGKMNFGSAGIGTTIHLAGEMLKSMAAISLVHVPYKSAGLAMTDVIAGNIQMMFAPIIVMQPMARAGKVRALAVTSSKRSALAPDIPTVGESVPGYEVTGWYGLLVPAATPRAVVDRLHAQSRSGMEAEAMKDRLKAQGLEVVNFSPERSAEFLRADIARWSRVIRDAGIKPE